LGEVISDPKVAFQGGLERLSPVEWLAAQQFKRHIFITPYKRFGLVLWPDDVDAGNLREQRCSVNFVETEIPVPPAESKADEVGEKIADVLRLGLTEEIEIDVVLRTVSARGQRA